MSSGAPTGLRSGQTGRARAKRPALRAAIVGAGLMGRWHAAYVPRAGGCVAYVVDLDAERASALAARCPQAESGHVSELARIAPEVDVVHVCTPAGTHEPIVELALAAGAHVLVEKPLAQSVSATRTLLSAAEQRGKLLAPVHQFPFQRAVRSLREALPSLGELTQVDYTTFTAGAEGRDDSGRRAVLLEILPHPISLFRALGFAATPEVLRVVRFDADALELRGELGKTTLQARIDLRARPPCNELRVAGRSGTAIVDLFHGFVSIDRAGASRASKLARPFRNSARISLSAFVNLAARALRQEPAYPGLPELVLAFYDAVRENRRAPIDPEESLWAAALADGLRPVRS